VETTFMKQTAVASAVALAALSAGCGEYVREQGRSPVQPVIVLLEAASGAEPEEMGGVLLSDVTTDVTTPDPCSTDNPCPTIFNDVAEVTMTLILKDPGVPGITAAPTALNQVTFNRYRVEYRRADGRNTQGVDVPFAFDSAVTFTVPDDGQATMDFQIVRHTAKTEAPLRALASSGDQISTIATVTFYGRDQAGNEVTAMGSIGIEFANFADPD
jgi:hypothetical protein